MKNFSVEVEGKTYWISRSIAVAGFIFSKLGNNWYILANKRGEGAPDYVGCWNCPCGYLDYDETLSEACSREIFEETGVSIREDELNFEEINDSLENRQNVTIRFTKFDDTGKLINQGLTSRYSEDQEVDDIKWIRVKSIDNYDWAFNHKEIIKDLAKFYLNFKYE